MRAKVKWWSDSKGYGFVTVGDGRDLFCHYSALHGEGFKTLIENSWIEVEVLEGPKGPQVGKATHWEQGKTLSAPEEVA